MHWLTLERNNYFFGRISGKIDIFLKSVFRRIYIWSEFQKSQNYFEIGEKPTFFQAYYKRPLHSNFINFYDIYAKNDFLTWLSVHQLQEIRKKWRTNGESLNAEKDLPRSPPATKSPSDGQLSKFYVCWAIFVPLNCFESAYLLKNWFEK